MRMLHTLVLVCAMLSIAWCPTALAADAPSQPPAPVVVATARSGMVLPRAEYVGTVEFTEESQVAAEVEGRVRSVRFEEGEHVRKGGMLVELSTDLLQQDSAAAKANLEKVRADLENAARELARQATLYKSRTVSEKSYDDARYAHQALSSQAMSLEAEVERLAIKISKARIRAPYDGVVLEKNADLGEWVSPGSVVATIARDDAVDVVVDVPQGVLSHIAPGQDVPVTVGPMRFVGKVFAVIPKGNVATRTFPVKVRIRDAQGLAQGMEARASLPSGAKTAVVLVPRDAVIQAYGQFSVWAAVDGKAVQIPVTVASYEGMQAAIMANGLKEGMQVVIKGNERLRPGQPVAPTQ
ncbi:MAG: efflux RND transporter periplasmic adaptor subunit [Desulfovibrionaceae bacterium]